MTVSARTTLCQLCGVHHNPEGPHHPAFDGSNVKETRCKECFKNSERPDMLTSTDEYPNTNRKTQRQPRFVPGVAHDMEVSE